MAAIGYLLAGAGDRIGVGLLSDALAPDSTGSVDGAAQGLQQAMMLAVPVAFAVAAFGMILAARFVKADRAAMLAPEPAL
ncbi:multisubunit Na+/H+ antiporter MnhC subunit [Allocatelliglobosispora scoriae]|uniref:Multisubunit Na+/H+ antiporter MnhC subunit n=1 Tax=Allocatelliglobosispora scoriae TaxID=643052 RepID=A0A841BF20_9ACTN|nr:hypothetical protein [Allocatelliglobosispora scoriae]MBB5866894.1 multisubunit Na+/H+ antiporter MnhC subunit [Allocatelliglobosispora scoriae]